ncbi:MAG: general secretion pathway protein GspK [Chthonomonas sp.]|nr:general secretion pathway protein GspK [Chthonomonas sp.]
MKRRGVVYIVALIGMAGLLAVLGGIAVRQRAVFAARQNRVDFARAEGIYESAVARAMAEIDLIEAGSATTLADDWALLGSGGNDNFIVGTGSFRLEIVDASSRLDLNSITVEELEKLGITEDLSDALLDWREAGQAPRAQGAKDEYYNTLTNPYNAAVEPFRTVNELLLVKGFTPATLYEPLQDAAAELISGDTTQLPILADMLSVGATSEPVQPEGATLQNLAQVQNAQAINQVIQNLPLATQIFNQRQQFQTMGDVMEVPGMTVAAAAQLLDRFTVGNAATYSGRTNLNTASEAVLNTLPNFTSDLSAGVLSLQEAGMTRMGEIAELPGMTPQILADVVDRVNLNSRSFLLRIQARYQTGTIEREVLVNLTDQGPQVVRYETVSQDDVANRWQWDAETGADIELITNS